MQRTEVVSGARSLPVRSTTFYTIIASLTVAIFYLGMTKIRKDKGLYMHL